MNIRPLASGWAGRILLTPIALASCIGFTAVAAEYQWSAPLAPGPTGQTQPIAYLWIPPDCTKVQAVVIGQHNMLEEPIFADTGFRRAMAELGFAIVWITPSADAVFRFDQGAGERFERVLSDLAETSGYSELATAPVVPIGHSAHASYPWNFAAWNPGRTLAVVSVKGDGPQTDCTGSGKPNPDWGDRTIDGVPGLMVMGEFEYRDPRSEPAFAYCRANPGTPISVIADTGHGHFDASARLIDRIVQFLRKAAAARLPEDGDSLRAVDPKKGWLVDRWRYGEPAKAPAAPYESYQGPREEAVWCFDEEMARSIEADYVAKGGQPQLAAYLVDGKPVPQEAGTHHQVRLPFQPGVDGISFAVHAGFDTHVPAGNPELWTKLPAGTALTHASDGGTVQVKAVAGPVEQHQDGHWRVAFHRGAPPASDRRAEEIWFVASHNGGSTHRSTVQHALLRIPLRRTEGRTQRIRFEEIPQQTAGVGTVELQAQSDAGLPVSFFVREGPAEVRGNELVLLPVPPRARYPIRVTVVAWQYGRDGEDPVQSAEPVERSFLLTRNAPQ